MCQSWSASLQKGMNFHLRPHCSVILMSRRPNAPYRDSIEDEGRVIIYEGHDVPRRQGQPDPKILDQPRTTPAGALTQNGLFEQAALRFRRGASEPESVAVYEKIRDGIWAFNGMFKLTDAWVESDSRRKVFKFRLEIILEGPAFELDLRAALDHNRVIPSVVKLEVWKRDRGCCVLCGETDNLHFDHDLPYSKGGTSLSAKNIRLLCARHNLSKSDKIQ
jgi:HNH endonuclease